MQNVVDLNQMTSSSFCNKLVLPPIFAEDEEKKNGDNSAQIILRHGQIPLGSNKNIRNIIHI